MRHGAQGWREERAPTLGQLAHSAVNPEGVPPNGTVNEGATPFGVGDDLKQATQGSPAVWRDNPGLRGATPLALYVFSVCQDEILVGAFAGAVRQKQPGKN